MIEGPIENKTEKLPKPRIILPEGWGDGSQKQETILAVLINPSLKDEAEKRNKVDAEMRAMIDELGIEVDERDYRVKNSVIREDQNEYTVIGQRDAIEDEIAEVREVVPDINVPKSYSMDEFENGTPLPVIVMFPGLSGGTGKYFIETEEQRKKFLNFCNSKDGKRLRKSFCFKESISTPDEHYTSYRVIVSATGRIMASALLYSGYTKEQPEYISSGIDPDYLGTPGHNLLDYLENESSPYYLRSQKFTSNVLGGGGIIPLNPSEKSRQITDQEREILDNHNIAEDGELPEKITEQAAAIGRSLGRKKSLYVGVDFIQNEDGDIYYLETNADPGVETYLACHNSGQGDVEVGYRMAMTDALSGIAVR